MVESIPQIPEAFLSTAGEIFAVFDDRTQDSGNVSFGIAVENKRYFVKTAGSPNNTLPYLSHAERVSLLDNAVRLSRSCDHALLPPLRHVIQSPWGPMLVYDWADGEHIYTPRQQRDDPKSAFQRFRRLPAAEITTVLDGIYDLHNQLALSGWIAVDFYDGCLIYDFATRQPHLVDLDMYRQGPFKNEMGRMFGSSRFMAPEEFTLNALIDQRSTVFTMGRTAFVLLSDGTLERPAFRSSGLLYAVLRRACAVAPEERFACVADFFADWRAARLAD